MIMRIGVFGGTFNPPHNGHIIISVFSIEYLNLDKLLIIPSYTPPHRTKPSVSFEMRCKMLQLAFGDIEKCEISTIERDLNLSYTYDVISTLKEKYGSSEFFLIIGYDQYMMRDKWYRWNDILKMTRVAVYPRGVEKNDVSDSIIYLPLPLIGISSTMIRERLKKEFSVKGMVDSKIIKFIEENNLYRR